MEKHKQLYLFEKIERKKGGDRATGNSRITRRVGLSFPSTRSENEQTWMC